MEQDLYNFICNDCPRKCNAVRSDNRADERADGIIYERADKRMDQIADEKAGQKSVTGFCGGSALMKVVRAAPHFGEEPCISGTKGSGAVFFEGCNLRCVFCQNYEISRMGKARNAGPGISGTGISEAGVPLQNVGKLYTPEGLRDVLLRLRDTGVHNINLVTPTHCARQIAAALDGLELGIPIVWNSSGYESAETLKSLEGLVQIYMPDWKYADKAIAKKYSAAEDYPERAEEAIKEMFRQRGAYKINSEGILESGVLIRHLILPGGGANTENSMDVIDKVADIFEAGTVLFSLMSQYTPMPAAVKFPELTQRVTQETVDLLKHYMKTRHLDDGYYQDVESATEEMIPQWDGTGL